MSKGARVRAERAAKQARKRFFEYHYGPMEYRLPRRNGSNRSSYNYTMPGAYVRKDERPGTTGLYRKDIGAGTMFQTRWRSHLPKRNNG